MLTLIPLVTGPSGGSDGKIDAATLLLVLVIATEDDMVGAGKSLDKEAVVAAVVGS